MSRKHFGFALAVLTVGVSGCTQTQVADTAKGAGGVLVETLVSTALDVALGSASNTRNLTDEELAQCRPRGDCLSRSHRKERATEAFIARNRSAYNRQVGVSESGLTNSLADWLDNDAPDKERAGESTSLMFRQPPLEDALGPVGSSAVAQPSTFPTAAEPRR